MPRKHVTASSSSIYLNIKVCGLLGGSAEALVPGNGFHHMTMYEEQEWTQNNI